MAIDDTGGGTEGIDVKMEVIRVVPDVNTEVNV